MHLEPRLLCHRGGLFAEQGARFRRIRRIWSRQHRLIIRPLEISAQFRLCKSWMKFLQIPDIHFYSPETIAFAGCHTESFEGTEDVLPAQHFLSVARLFGALLAVLLQQSSPHLGACKGARLIYPLLFCIPNHKLKFEAALQAVGGCRAQRTTCLPQSCLHKLLSDL